MPSGGGTRALERRGYAVAVISSTESASGSHCSGLSLAESEEPITSGRYGHVNSIEVWPDAAAGFLDGQGNGSEYSRCCW